MLASEAISAAYREADVTLLGDAPNDSENAEALVLLNAFVTRLFGTEFGENMQDWPLPPRNTAYLPDNLVSPNMGLTWFEAPRTNSRVLLKTQAATTVKFPSEPSDGSQIAIVDVGSTSALVTLDGNGRLIAGNPTQIDTPQAFNGRRYVYRADLASWQEVKALGLNDTLPLVSDFDDLFISYLALRLGPRNASEPMEPTTTIYTDLLKRARRRYRQEQAIAVADNRISQSEQSFGSPGMRGSWFM